MGIGKTSLVDAACRRAATRARGPPCARVRARGGLRLWPRAPAVRATPGRDGERRGARGAPRRPRACGATAVRQWPVADTPALSTSFAVLHGLYWLTVNLADRRPLLLAVDDAHAADEPSLRWLAYLAPRMEGLALSLVVALRPVEPASMGASLAALRLAAPTVIRPALLTQGAAAAIVRAGTAGDPNDELCAALWTASGGNPLYLGELLRAAQLDPAEPVSGGLDGIARRVLARHPRVGPGRAAPRPGAGRARRRVPAPPRGGDRGDQDVDVPPAWPQGSCGSPRCWPATTLRASCRTGGPRRGRGVAGKRRARRAPSTQPPRVLHPHRAPAGAGRRASRRRATRRPTHGCWSACRRPAREAMEAGPAPEAAARSAVPCARPSRPPRAQRVRRAAHRRRAPDASAGRDSACSKTRGGAPAGAAIRHERAEIAMELAEVYAALFRWVDAVDLIERALTQLARAATRSSPRGWRASSSCPVCTTRAGRRASRRCSNGSRRVRSQAAPAEAARRRDGHVRWCSPAGRRRREALAPLEPARFPAPETRVAELGHDEPLSSGAWSPSSALRRGRRRARSR